MKNYSTKIVSIILAISMMFSIVGGMTVYAANESLDDSIVAVEGTEIVEENAEINTVDVEVPDASVEILPSDGLSGAQEGDEVIGIDGEEEFPENSFSSPDGSDEDLGFGEDDENNVVLDEEMVDVSLNEESGDDISLFAASIKASSTNVVVTKGSSTKVTMSYSGYSGSVYMQYGRTSSSYSCSWGSWSNNKIPLTIKGDYTGSGYIYVYLKKANGTTLASTKISVTVASPTLSASTTSISVKQGNTYSVTMSYSGYNGSVYMQYSTNNSSSYSCSWGSWSRSSIPLRINGKKIGSGTITVYLKSTSGVKLATKKIYVSVTSPQTPKLTLSASSKSIAVGSSAKIIASYSGYSGSVYMQYGTSNGSAYKCSWGSWSGSSVPLTVSSKAVGSGTITVYLKSASTNATLATATLKVSIYSNDNPKLTATATSASLKVGNSAVIKFTVSGVSGSYYLSYSNSNSNAYKCSWGGWSGSTIPLTITGKNKGSGYITVYLKNSSGTTLKSLTISPITIAAVSNPSVTVSPSSVNLSIGSSQNITCSYANCSDTIYMSFSVGNNNIVSGSWGSKWSGNSIPLKLTAKASGSTTVTVYLKKSSNNQTLASKTINVKVEGKSFSDVAYGFSNYSKEHISLANCKKMFGNTQTAQNVYNAKIGNGGVCFGMAMSSSLITAPTNSIYVSTFNNSAAKISNLSKSNYSNSLKMYVSDFVEATHISQVSSQMSRNYSLNELASTVISQTSQNIPVMVSMRGAYGGSDAGHAVVAYAYEQTSSTKLTIKIYDSNKSEPMNLILTRPSSSSAYNTWSYPGYLNWGSGKRYASISFITYSTYNNVWNKRGTLTSSWFNLLSVKEDDFAVYNFDNELVARYENNSLVEKSEDVIEVFFDNIMPDGSYVETPNMLYLPKDYYTIVDEDLNDPIEAMLSDQELSIKVATGAETFDICADDDYDVANALLTPGDGVDYSISIGSSRDGEPDEQNVEGIGTGEQIGVSFEEGVISLSSESLGLSTESIEEEFEIIAGTNDGGTITNSGTKVFKESENCMYDIVPSEGYSIKAVYVDGEDVGALTSYYFEDITDNHTIYAEFTKNIDTCTFEIENDFYQYSGAEIHPTVTVVDGDYTLVENIDYTISYIDNVMPGKAGVLVTAMDESGYSGIKIIEFTIDADNYVQEVTYNSVENKINSVIKNAEDCSVVIAIYDTTGKMLYVNSQPISVGAGNAPFYLEDFEIKGEYTIKLFMFNLLTNIKPISPAYITKFENLI